MWLLFYLNVHKEKQFEIVAVADEINSICIRNIVIMS